MDKSILVQFNRALDEYIASHYIPFPSPAVFDECLELDDLKELRIPQSEYDGSKESSKHEPARRYSIAKKKHTAKEKISSFKDAAETVFQDILNIFNQPVSTPSSAESIDPFDVLDIDDFLRESKNLETFTESMLRIIREKELIEADVYNSVFMDRKLFNKIRNDRNYQPSKRTALLLSIALQLTVQETQVFLEKAGYSLTHTSKVDIVIEFFMIQGNYNILDINEALYDRDLPLLNPHV